ncbi:uncharacterized protein BDW47DRAFT_97425 [Aspergillus candidus]|uniref:Uncharacterized protein n=1 Tax=Aspergillus candidus TaxID=41067 RepID=A0A2I2FPN4_ASPCN|nr:hypothetical protein BDW47DRAFT_97425 [Aspergillus candidus]PLB42571.1 hypothetical protein BDW47DRAFT_97425 [Aspergillus candidus]
MRSLTYVIFAHLSMISLLGNLCRQNKKMQSERCGVTRGRNTKLSPNQVVRVRWGCAEPGQRLNGV